MNLVSLLGYMTYLKLDIFERLDTVYLKKIANWLSIFFQMKKNAIFRRYCDVYYTLHTLFILSLMSQPYYYNRLLHTKKREIPSDY